MNEQTKRAGRILWSLGKKAGKAAASASPEAKSAGAGAGVLAGLGAMAGPHVGIAALGTAVSGALILPAVGVVVGGLGGYALYKKLTSRQEPGAGGKGNP